MAQRMRWFITLWSFIVMYGPALYAQKEKPRYIVTVKTRTVRIHAIVLDEKGMPVTDLTKEDFRVFDDGVRQKITEFSSLYEAVSYMALPDNSSSMARKMPFVREAVHVLLEPFSDIEGQGKTADEFSILPFSTRAASPTPFMRGEDLQPKVDDLLPVTNGSTALFDAVYRAAYAINQNANNGRQAMILITDGGDNHSRYSLRETRKLLEEADIPVFAVIAGPSITLLGFSPEPPIPIRGGQVKLSPSLYPNEEDVLGPAEQRGPHNLKMLTEDTGGEVFTVSRLEEVPEVVRAIGDMLHYSYIIGYEVPEGEKHPKKWDGKHKVSLQLEPEEKYKKYLVTARRSYYEGYQ